MPTSIANQTAALGPLPGSGNGNGDGATITQSPTIVSATLANKDQIAYSRPTMSYKVSSQQKGYAIYGYGNGSFGVDDKNTNSIVAISPTRDVTLQQNAKTVSLGNLQDPATQSRLTSLLSPDAYADLKTAMATKNLSNTSIAHEFSPATIGDLTSVQGQDTVKILHQNQPPGIAPNMAAPPNMGYDQYGAPGTYGATGDPGDYATLGPPGAYALAGPPGASGAIGAPGSSGANGTPGAAGPIGPPSNSGAVGPPGSYGPTTSPAYSQYVASNPNLST